MKRLFLHILFLIFSLYNGCLHASSLRKVSQLAAKIHTAYMNKDQQLVEYYLNASHFLSHNENQLCQYLTQALINRDEIESELKKNSDIDILIDQKQNEHDIAIIYNELHTLDQQNSSLSFLQKWVNAIDNKLRGPVYYNDVTLDENPSSMRLRILGLADHLSQEKNMTLKQKRLYQGGYQAPEYSNKAIDDSLKKLCKM